MKSPIHLTFILSLCVCLASVAQQRTILGTITDKEDKSALIGVSIIEKGTSNGTVTDLDGKYSFEIGTGEVTVVWSYVGYNSVEKLIPAGTANVTNDITLETESVGINVVTVSASKRKEKLLDAPASVTVISAEKIEANAALTAADHLKNVPGVDVIETGLVASNVNVRGFNNIFSGAMLTMVDNRIARVPSLRLNAFQLVPTTNHDIAKMELVRGPGSALYGPNASAGVFHTITKSPLDEEKNFTTIASIGLGMRANGENENKDMGDRFIYQPELWHAGKITDKIGYKISGQYMTGNDWEQFDPREPAEGDTVIFGTVLGGEIYQQDTTIPPAPFHRDFEIVKYSGDARIDFRPKDEMEIIVNGGLANTKNLELTGLGAAQSKGWTYWYAQARFRHKNLFVQYFMNSSNSGDETYLIPQSGNQIQFLTDKSKLHVAQIQHSYEPTDNLFFTYGFDALMTRPETEGTINGRFEDNDNIGQYGGYVQGEYKPIDWLKFVAAGRVDYHDVIDETVVSPRAALVVKPTSRQTIRATYNRAFSTPSSLNLFLDISNGYVPSGFDVRGIGNPEGYNYNYASDGSIQMYSPYLQNWVDPIDQSSNHVYFDGMTGIVGEGLGDAAGVSATFVNETILRQLFTGISSDTGLVMNVPLVAIDFVEALETGDFQGSLWNGNGDVSSIEDKGRVESSFTQTAEVGYKGLLGGKLLLQADIYYTKISNFVSPLSLATASVVFDQTTLLSIMGPPDDNGILWQNLNDTTVDLSPLPVPSDYTLNDLLLGLLDGDSSYIDPSGTIPSIPGTVWDEVMVIIAGANRQLPAGNVTPDDDLVGSDIILTYLNLGDVDLWGADVGFTYIAQQNDQMDLSFSGSYSWVSKDSIVLEGAANGYVGLNAPKHKMSLAANFTHHGTGIGGGLNWRWQDGFPANSAVYVGHVEAAHFADLQLSYRPNFSKNTLVALNISNLFNNLHQRFPGTPKIGRLGFLKLQQKF